MPKNFTEDEIKGFLAQQGYTRIHQHEGAQLEVIQDRVRLNGENRARIVEDLEAALKHGRGRVTVTPLEGDGKPSTAWRFSSALHCAECDIAYRDLVPNFFSFNSPMGACEICRGFGRSIGIDYGLVIPDESKTLRQGAIKPWQTQSYGECQDDVMRFAKKRGVPTDVPWRELSEKHKNWVIQGEGSWEDKLWYGVERFFQWLGQSLQNARARAALTLDRQSRTLSGGEVQRINLTTALGTSLVNTLFVLDEPSIGLHFDDIATLLKAFQRLLEEGNTLVVPV